MGSSIPLAGQDQPGPLPGARIQVWAPNRFEGTFQRTTPTTLVVQPDRSSPIEIPLSGVRELRIEHGTRGHPVRVGVLGFVGGLLLGGPAKAVVGAGLGALLGTQIRSPRFARWSLREIRPTPLPGTWVRVTTDRGRTQGTVRAATADSVVVDVEGRLHAIPSGAITTLEWPIGRDRLGRSGFLVGAAVGAGAGALAGFALGSECQNSDHYLCGGGGGVGGFVIGGGFLGAGVAGLIGLAIGHGINQTRWEAGFIPLLSPRRIGLAGTIRF